MNIKAFLFFLVILGFFNLTPQKSYANCLNVTPSFSSSSTDLCGVGPYLISFTNTSTGINSNTTGYQWYVNGVAFANTTGTFVGTTNTITALGSYTFMMVAFDTLSFCLDTAFHTVTISQPPVANFSFPSGNICPNSMVSFTNNSSSLNAGAYYFWDFGDGGTDSSQNPTHSYGAGGIYSVSLTVYNSDSCWVTTTQNITVLNTPNINIAGDDGDGNTFRCLNAIDTVSQEVVTFFNTSAPGITYTWDFGDGTPSVSQTFAAGPDTITHLFTSYGTFPVICSAVDTNGCTYTDTLFVVFEKFISASFTVPLSDISGCAPHTVTPVNNSINATRYEWDFGDGSPIITTTVMVAPTHIYDSTGVYNITLRAINDCGFSISTVGPITVSVAPDVDFLLSIFTRGCSPQSITVVDNSQFIFPINNFVWNMGNGNVYNGINPPAQIYLQGNHIIKLVGSNGCGSDSMSQILRVDSLPYAQVSVSPTVGCSGLQISGSAINFGYGTLSRWYADGVQVGFGDTLPTQTFINNSNSIQNHTIRYNLTNHCGSYDSTFVITVHPEVTAILDATPNPICSGDSLIHQSISFGDSLLYFWSFGDGTTSNSLGPHIKFYNTKGIDSVMLKVTGYCGVDSVKKIILIDSLPYANVSISPLEGCSPVNVSGGAVPFGNNTTANWYRNSSLYWSGNSLPSTTFTNSGNSVINNTFRYNLSNHCGSYDTTFTIKVHPQVLARMTPINATVCVGDSLQFRNVSNGDSLTFLWEFGNGDTSTFSGPHYITFNTPGVDTTWLYVDGYCGRDSTFSITTVNRFPVARILADVDSGCEDLSVNFTNDAPNGANYLWNINGGFPFMSFSYTPSVLFTTPGFNSVYLSVDSLGCVSNDTATITVFPGPSASFTYTPLSGCSDLDVAITNTSPVSFGDRYSWTFGNGNSDTLYSPPDQTLINPTNLFDSVYPLKLVVYTANGCNDSITQSVTVHPLPSSSFTFSDSIACEKEMLSFQNTSVGANSIKWYFGDGDSSFINSPNHSYDTAGVYTVTLISTTVWNCQDTSYQLITVNPNPVVSFFADSVCLTYLTSFTDSSLFGPINWKWKFGDGDTSIIQNPTHLYLNDSIYSVSLFASNAFGCFDSVINDIVVYDRPVANFGNSTACAKKMTSFYDSSSSNPVRWSWDFGDGNIDSVKNPTNIYLVGGIYPVTLIVENSSGCIDTITKLITISTVPQTYFIANAVCLGSPTLFIDSTVLGYPVTSYFWDFGDGNFSGLQNPTYQYINSGTYFVSLTVTNINGCDSTFSDSVFVNLKPTANFIFDTVCNGVTTSFSRSVSPNNPVYYIWDYGDGTSIDTNNSAIINYTYAFDGVYSVTLKVINASGCEDSITNTVIVYPMPDAQFLPQQDSLCLSDSVTFINNSIGGNSFLWSFGDGNTSNLINSIHTYALTGTYQINLLVQSPNGCLDSIIDTVSVFNKPLANFGFDTVCENLSTTFSNLSSGGSFTSIWDYGDGSPLDTNNNLFISHQYATDGVYTVKLVLINPSGCHDSISYSVIIYPMPLASFSPQVDSICLGDSITFLNNSLAASTYLWSFGDGNNSFLINPVHTFSVSGVYQISLFVQNPQGCSDTIIDSVFVLDNPIAAFNIDTVCFSNPTSFTDLSSGIISSWNWNFGDGNTSNIQNPTHIYGVDSSFNVALSVTSPFGCSDTTSETAVVLPIVDAQFNYTLACVGRTIYFTDSSAGLPVSWNWNFGDGNTSLVQNPNHSYSTTGNYTVTLIISNVAGCSDTISKVIFVNSIPVPDFTADTVCIGNSMSFTNLTTNTQPITSYFWSFGDGNNSYSTNPNYTFAAPGIYIVTLTVTNNGGCDSSISKSVVVNSNPVANFSYDTVCVGLATTFTDSSSGNPISWEWNFGDFSPIDSTSGSVATHSYTSAGLYTASLRVRSGINGCTDQIIKYITVLGGVNASFSVSNPICEGTSVQFVNNSTTSGAPISSSSWSFGDGNTSVLNNPINTYGVAGVYKVVLSIASGQGCIDSDSINVIVNAVPTVNFGFTKNICLGFPTNFYDSSTVSVGVVSNWNWSFGDGNADTLKNPFNIYNTPGTYLVNLQVTTDSGCSNVVSKNLTINPESVVNFTYNSVCVGDTISFKDISSIVSPDSIIGWYWEFGDGTTSNLKNPAHQYIGNTQSYLVKLTVTSKYGCLNDTTILVSYLPVPVFNYGPQFFGYCVDETVSFYDSSVITPPATIVGWEWNFGDSHKSFLQNTTHVFDSAGSYNIKLKTTSSDGCVFYDSLAAPLIIYPKPIPDFLTVPSTVSVFRPEVYFDNKTSGAVSYIWDFGDGTSGTDDFPTHIFPNVSGFYTTTQYAFSAFGCMDSISKTIFVKEEFTLYIPNAFTPDKDFNNTFLVKGYEINGFHLKIFNRWGELLFETKDIKEGWNGKHKGTDCPVGAYVFVIKAKDNIGNDHSKTGHLNLIR